MKNKIAKPSPKIEPLPGAVVAQWVRCGRRNCKCAQGELHGPFYYRYWRDGPKRHKTYVRKADVSAVQAACAAYRNELRKEQKLRQASLAEWRRLKALLKEGEA